MVSLISDKEVDFFSLFGVESKYEQDLIELKQRWYQLQRQYHPDNYINASNEDKNKVIEIAAIINTAYQTLISPVKRAIYLLKTKGIELDSETNTNMPAEFLMEQMEIRERMLEGEDLSQEIAVALQACEQDFIQALSNPAHSEQAKLALRKMMFYTKLQGSQHA